MKTIDPGELNQRITFQARAAGQDVLGQPNGAWANVATDPEVWAKSANVSSRDIAAAGAHQSSLDAKFVIHWRADVLATWRVLWRGQAYKIVGDPAALSGGTDWLEIRCVRMLST
jgi:SPP1 family predicted phage head-tail adaptor